MHWFMKTFYLIAFAFEGFFTIQQEKHNQTNKTDDLCKSKTGAFPSPPTTERATFRLQAQFASFVKELYNLSEGMGGRCI